MSTGPKPRLIQTFTHPDNAGAMGPGPASKVYWNSEHEEFVVKFWRDGQHQVEADYFTPYRDDALGTGQLHLVRAEYA